MQMQKQYSGFFITLLLLSVAHLATSQEVRDEKEFTYDEESPNGPKHWGELNPEWSMCNEGEMQSPIDLKNERVTITSKLGRLDRDYRPSNATLVNRGHDMMLEWQEGAGHLHINGTEYRLNQCHWHTPSEHSINGKRFALEVHLVHQSLDGKVAVVGIMYKLGRPDSFLTMMTNHLEALTHVREVEKGVGIVDPEHIKIGSRKYYRYIGSLTTPPCTQNVVWTIVRKVRTVSREQLNLIREAVHDEAEANARPIQPINTRLIKLYRPNDIEGR